MTLPIQRRNLWQIPAILILISAWAASALAQPRAEEAMKKLQPMIGKWLAEGKYYNNTECVYPKGCPILSTARIGKLEISELYLHMTMDILTWPFSDSLTFSYDVFQKKYRIVGLSDSPTGLVEVYEGHFDDTKNTLILDSTTWNSDSHGKIHYRLELKLPNSKKEGFSGKMAARYEEKEWEPFYYLSFEPR